MSRNGVRISIFVRILFPLLLAFALIQAAVVVGMRMARHSHGHGTRHAGDGPPPERRLVRRLLELRSKVHPEQGVTAAASLLGDEDLAFDGPRESWRTQETLPRW